jgi:hypothetical protein
MSRYSPTVLPQPNMTFADVLAGLSRGVDYGMSLQDRLRQRKQQEEEFEATRRQGQLGEALGREQAQRQGIVPAPTRLPEQLDMSRPLPPSLDLSAYLPTVRTPAIDTAHPERMTATGLGPSALQRQRPLGQTGYVYDPAVAEEEEQQSLGHYLARQMPLWGQRTQLEQEKEKAALQRTTVQQTGATERERARNDRLAAAAAATTAARLRIASTPRPQQAAVAGQRDRTYWAGELRDAEHERDLIQSEALGANAAVREPGAAPDFSAATYQKDPTAYGADRARYQRQSRAWTDHQQRLQAAEQRVQRAQGQLGSVAPAGRAAPVAPVTRPARAAAHPAAAPRTAQPAAAISPADEWEQIRRTVQSDSAATSEYYRRHPRP